MGSLLTDVTAGGNIPVLEKLLAYAEAGQRMLADNIANVDNPDYKTKQLDPRLFQAALRQALDQCPDPRAPLDIPATDQFQLDDQGKLRVTPAETPVQNILFHDRTNARVEQLMSQLAENVLTYNAAAQLLRGNFDSIKTAIRGQV